MIFSEAPDMSLRVETSSPRSNSPPPQQQSRQQYPPPVKLLGAFNYTINIMHTNFFNIIFYFAFSVRLVNLVAIVLMSAIPITKGGWVVVMTTTTLIPVHSNTSSRTYDITKGDIPCTTRRQVPTHPPSLRTTEDFIPMATKMLDTVKDGRITCSHMTITWRRVTADTILINDTVAPMGGDDLSFFLLIIYKKLMHFIVKTHTSDTPSC